MKNRHLTALLCALLSATPLLTGPSLADPVRAPLVKDSAGRPTSATPVITVDENGAYVAPGGGGGGGGGSGTEFAEDAAHSSGALGTLALAVRKDTATALAGTDGDYSVLITDSTGRLHVNTGTVTITDGSGPLTVDGTVTANLGTLNGAATSAKQDTIISAVDGLEALLGSTLVVGDGGSTVSIDDGGGSVTVDGTVAVTGVATAAKQPALGTAGSASTDVITIQGIASGTVVPVADGGGSLTVDGTVAATQSGTWNVTNVSGTVSLPTGASTAANQTTIIGYVDGIETALAGTLTVGDGGATLSIDDGAGSITVDGTVAVTGVSTSAKQDTIISAVDGIEGLLGGTLLVGDGSGSLTVDGAVTVSGVSTAAKQPALGTAGSASADVITVQGVSGGTNLNVNCAAGCAGGTQFAEDLAAQSADAGTVALSVRRDTAASSAGTDGDYATLNTDATGYLWTRVGVSALPSGAATSALQDDSYAPVAAGTATATTSTLAGCQYLSTLPTFSNTQQGALTCGTRGSLNVQLAGPDSTAFADVRSSGADAASNAITGLQTYGRNSIYNGSTWDRAKGISDATNSTGTGIQAVGLIGQCNDIAPTALTENQFGNARVSCTTGALLVRPYETQANTWNYAAASGGISNTTTAVTIKAAAGSGVKNCLTGVDLQAPALGAATEVAIRDGAGGTVLWRSYIGTGGQPLTDREFASPICGTANTLLEAVTLTATVTGAVYLNATGYVTP